MSCRRIGHWIGRWIAGGAAALDGDQRGTSLTEFAITLPIFVAVMAFVYYMGAAGHVVTDEVNRAHRDLWDDALHHTTAGHDPVGYNDPGQPHAHPASGADEDRQFFAEQQLRQRIDGLNTDVRSEEVQTYQALSAGGHWGESHRRTRAPHGQLEFANNADQMTNSPTAVLGGSNYARDLVDDSGGTFELGAGGGGPLGPAASFGLGESVIPAVGAGIRYGVTHSVREGEVTFPHGWTIPVRFHFDALVPPTPVANQKTPTAITRLKLESYQPYSELLGIAMEQPLGPAAPAPSSPTWPDD